MSRRTRRVPHGTAAGSLARRPGSGGVTAFLWTAGRPLVRGGVHCIHSPPWRTSRAPASARR
eukprot:3388246-Prymnesium_polylepis.1